MKDLNTIGREKAALRQSTMSTRRNMARLLAFSFLFIAMLATFGALRPEHAPVAMALASTQRDLPCAGQSAPVAAEYKRANRKRRIVRRKRKLAPVAVAQTCPCECVEPKLSTTKTAGK